MYSDTKLCTWLFFIGPAYSLLCTFVRTNNKTGRRQTRDIIEIVTYLTIKVEVLLLEVLLVKFLLLEVLLIEVFLVEVL